jgi:hypothetical protein
LAADGEDGMRTTYSALLTIVLTGILSSTVGAAEAAGTQRVALLELYTSEGCNSCPPADRFVSSLPRPQLVPHKLVVLAFHVDYWNYLGWNDRFSQQRFSARQQEQVRANGLRTAYTPQLVLNGRDHRDTAGIETQVARINAQASHIDLTLRADLKGSSLHVSAQVNQAVSSPEPMELYIALYENNLESQVQAGENRGRLLRHDYVVRTLIGPVTVAPDKPLRWQDQMALAADWKRADLGLAAFVQSTRSGEVLQAIAQALQ